MIQIIKPTSCWTCKGTSIAVQHNLYLYLLSKLAHFEQLSCLTPVRGHCTHLSKSERPAISLWSEELLRLPLKSAEKKAPKSG